MNAGRAAVALATLATSQPFVAALVRDVHILVHSFALTWTWLAGQTTHPATPCPSGTPSAPPTLLRAEYGALLVFERVWTRNQWHHLSTVLGREPETRRALYAAAMRALLDTLADPEVLHAVGGVLGAFLLSASMHGTQPPVGMDRATLQRLQGLPERARTALDAGSRAPSVPPSADVWWVVQALLGQTPEGHAPPALALHLPDAPLHLAPSTVLTTRGARAAHPPPLGTVGQRTPQTAPRHGARPHHEEVHASIAAAVGIPDGAPAQGPTTHTADALAALGHAQEAYLGARRVLDELLHDVRAAEAAACAAPAYLVR